MKELLPTITEDVNNVLNLEYEDENRVIILTGLEKEGLKIPTEKDVLAVLDV